MTIFLQQLINGLVLGSGYACIALGWTVLLGAARLVNFAHGQLYMLAAFVGWYAMHRLGVPYFASIPIAILALLLVGAAMQGAMTRLVLEQNLTSLMIVTLGFGYLITGGAAVLFGGAPQADSPSMTGSRRRISSAGSTVAAPGRVDSAPRSRMSAPCSTMASPASIAALGSR